MEGFIKLPRSILEWEWFDDPNTLRVYLKLLFLAEYSDKRYKGCEIKRGQYLTTGANLSRLCGLSVQQMKTILERLKSTNKITVKATTQYSIITLIEYDYNPENNKQSNQPITNEQPTTQPTNNQASLLTNKAKNKESQENTQAYLRAPAGEGENNNYYSESFERFWSAYPRKTAKQNAFRFWVKLKPDEELVNTILLALERFKKTEQWQRDNGRYIPYPASWLGNRRWEDEIPEPVTAVKPAASAVDNIRSPVRSSMIPSQSSFAVDDIMAQIYERYRRGGD